MKSNIRLTMLSFGVCAATLIACGCQHDNPPAAAAPPPAAPAPVVTAPPVATPPAPAAPVAPPVQNVVAAPTTQPTMEPTVAAFPIPLPGADAPDFTLASNLQKQITLSSYQGRIVVLYFYPKAGTPGCTKEACAFRDAAAAYDKENVAVLGISPDPVPDISKFGENFHLNFPLLADSDHAVAEKYGVWQPRTSHGEIHMGIARTTFVIGKDGKIIHVFEKVKPEGHDQQVLHWIQDNVDVKAHA